MGLEWTRVLAGMRHIVLSGPVLDEIQEAAMVALLLRKPA